MASSHAETIAAIATAPGRGAIGVVRVSGQGLARFAEVLTGKQPTPRHASLVTFRDANGEAIDRGILVFFQAPHSFTGEDVLELQGHGGPVAMQQLLVRCCTVGARLAEPGEFTRRAFLNDKMDLAQAEAVADLIEANTAQAARSAMRSLSGEFSAAVLALVHDLVESRMLVEAMLDFPEEDLDHLRDAELLPRLRGLCGALGKLLARARQGSLLRTGMVVVLVGVPNVGKSSLLNRLAGEDRAIVTDMPGTTRDALRETIQIEGIPLHIIDTAGLRDSNDEIERLGIERSWREIGKADVIVHMVDARGGVTPADRGVAARLPSRVERIIVENKCDLAHHGAARFDVQGQVHLRLSAKTGDGMGLLHDELLRVAGWHQGRGESVILARQRHLNALAETAQHLDMAEAQVSQLELAAEELRLAQGALSSITGEFAADDLLGEIFSRFCIGK